MFVSCGTSSPRTERLLRGKFHSVSLTGILSLNKKTQDKLLGSDRGLLPLNFLRFFGTFFRMMDNTRRKGNICAYIKLITE